jgi:hypothetical protein
MNNRELRAATKQRLTALRAAIKQRRAEHGQDRQISPAGTAIGRQLLDGSWPRRFEHVTWPEHPEAQFNADAATEPPNTTPNCLTKQRG